jgi:hypothetical protein
MYFHPSHCRWYHRSADGSRWIPVPDADAPDDPKDADSDE